MMPVTTWPNIDDAFATISRGIRETVDDLLRREEEKVKKLVEEKQKANVLDAASAAEIYRNIQRDSQKAQMERWQILQDLQTKIFEIQQNVTAQQAVTQDKMFKKWDEYIKQS
jgi:PIN domain nuclease of toxin-antitoxin system